MELKVRHITCDRCRKKLSISSLRGDGEKHEFTCPCCENELKAQGFVAVITAEYEKALLGRMYTLHLATWIFFGLSALCTITCCGIMFFTPGSFYNPDFISVLLALALNGSWYIMVIALLLMFSALIEQGLPSHKLITAASAFISCGLLYIQSRYFIAPENITLWLTFLGAIIVLCICMSVFDGSPHR